MNIELEDIINGIVRECPKYEDCRDNYLNDDDLATYIPFNCRRLGCIGYECYSQGYDSGYKHGYRKGIRDITRDYSRGPKITEDDEEAKDKSK